MKKSHVFLLLMLFSSLKVFSQEPRIDAIRQHYQEVKALCSDTLEYDGYYHDQVLTNVNDKPCRAVGNYQNVVDFWYGDLMDADQGEEGGDSLNALYLVTVKTEIAGRNEYREFLFKDGKLIFYFEQSRNGEETLEYRFYYDRGKLFRFMQGNEIIGYDGDSQEPIVKAKGWQNLFMQLFNH